MVFLSLVRRGCHSKQEWVWVLFFCCCEKIQLANTHKKITEIKTLSQLNSKKSIIECAACVFMLSSEMSVIKIKGKASAFVNRIFCFFFLLSLHFINFGSKQFRLLYFRRWKGSNERINRLHFHCCGPEIFVRLPLASNWNFSPENIMKFVVNLFCFCVLCIIFFFLGHSEYTVRNGLVEKQKLWTQKKEKT